MPWLADTVGRRVRGCPGVSRRLDGRGIARRALRALADLVPADVVIWDRVELATGAVRHNAVPPEAEPPGAFEAVVGRAADDPLLAAHAVRRRPALRLSELVEPGSLTHCALYGDLLHAAGSMKD